MTQRFCPECGTAAQPAHRFCQRCGAALPSPAAAPPEAALPALEPDRLTPSHHEARQWTLLSPAAIALILAGIGAVAVLAIFRDGSGEPLAGLSDQQLGGGEQVRGAGVTVELPKGWLHQVDQSHLVAGSPNASLDWTDKSPGAARLHVHRIGAADPVPDFATVFGDPDTRTEAGTFRTIESARQTKIAGLDAVALTYSVGSGEGEVVTRYVLARSGQQDTLVFYAQAPAATWKADSRGLDRILAGVALDGGSSTPTPKGFRTFGTGIHTVGTDIAPGTYRMRSGAPACYYSRLRGTGGTQAEVIESRFGQGPFIITVAATDAAFESRECGTWTQDLSAITASPTGPLPGSGVYIVGVDVAPGTWRSDGQSDCYWARLADFSGFEGIVENAFLPQPQTVTIAPGDKGFDTDQCGTWTMVQ